MSFDKRSNAAQNPVRPGFAGASQQKNNPQKNNMKSGSQGKPSQQFPPLQDPWEGRWAVVRLMASEV